MNYYTFCNDRFEVYEEGTNKWMASFSDAECMILSFPSAVGVIELFPSDPIGEITEENLNELGFKIATFLGKHNTFIKFYLSANKVSREVEIINLSETPLFKKEKDVNQSDVEARSKEFESWS